MKNNGSIIIFHDNYNYKVLMQELARNEIMNLNGKVLNSPKYWFWVKMYPKTYSIPLGLLLFSAMGEK